jgi:hypothetical protein
LGENKAGGSLYPVSSLSVVRSVVPHRNHSRNSRDQKKRKFRQEDGEILEPGRDCTSIRAILLRLTHSTKLASAFTRTSKPVCAILLLKTSAYKERKKENVQNSALRELIEPVPTEAWANAAKEFAKIPLEGDQHQPRFVPLIDVITGVANDRKAKEFVAVWRIVKLPWLFEVSATRRPPAFATRRAWKSFAAGSFSEAEIQPNNEASIARINFAEFLKFKSPLSLTRQSYSYLKEETPGPVHEVITIEMVRQAVCELTDLNFFFDMFEIEYRRTYDAPGDIEGRMSSIMSPGTLSFPQPIPRSDLADRAKWLVRVRDFMRDWEGPKPPAFDTEPSNLTALGDILHFESAVATVYCSNVTHILRRRPVIPRYK